MTTNLSTRAIGRSESRRFMEVSDELMLRVVRDVYLFMWALGQGSRYLQRARSPTPVGPGRISLCYEIATVPSASSLWTGSLLSSRDNRGSCIHNSLKCLPDKRVISAIGADRACPHHFVVLSAYLDLSRGHSEYSDLWFLSCSRHPDNCGCIFYFILFVAGLQLAAYYRGIRTSHSRLSQTGGVVPLRYLDGY